MSVSIYNQLVGKTFKSVIADRNNDTIEFRFFDDTGYVFYHLQDCCECVTIKQIDGDLEDLTGSPIIQAEEVTESKEAEYGSETWTFYKFATIKGSVTIQWLGSSNGCYSESVSFRELSAGEYDRLYPNTIKE